MISFNVPSITGKELFYMQQVLTDKKFSGDGEFTRKCNRWFEQQFQAIKALLTTSCTHALEMAAILADIQPGDEVIMPSYTFVSTANAFVLRGAKIIFVDVRPDTMNINEKLIERAISSKTKAIVPVHYAGVACEMDIIMTLANKYDLVVIEDAAQGVMSKYKGRPLGTIGHMGCYSFHETKNYQCGEGGALIINDERYVERAEIVREKGTNRSRFFRGQVDKYTWVDVGSSYLPSELNAAFLYAQLENAQQINEDRLSSWQLYYSQLKPYSDLDLLELPHIPSGCDHNAHMFYIKLQDLEQRTALINALKENDILSVFHYIPLHSAEAGSRFGYFHGDDIFTTSESERLVRLPMFYGLEAHTIKRITGIIGSFLENRMGTRERIS